MDQFSLFKCLKVSSGLAMCLFLFEGIVWKMQHHKERKKKQPTELLSMKILSL